MEIRGKNRDFLLKILREEMDREPNILFSYLYGSYAYGIIHSESDIDVAVYITPSEMNEYLKMEKRILSSLIDKIHTDKIDLRIINTLPLILQYQILKEGIPILIKDEQARVDFETQVMIRFFELKPYIDEYREMLLLRTQKTSYKESSKKLSRFLK
jgi:predicted nucleotidyltransferase